MANEYEPYQGVIMLMLRSYHAYGLHWGDPFL